jgi:RNA polymerase sigma factor (TIGR02999 family)
MQAQTDNITDLLTRWREGDRTALDRLVPLIRHDLRRIAQRHLGRERKDHNLQPSSLVQEVFLRLLTDREMRCQNRTHFLAVASQVMRHVLVDYARERRRVKRGGAAIHIPIDAAVILSLDQVEQIVTVDLALERLARIDERKSRVLEMRFFGGLSVLETAEVLGVAPNTVIRDWKFACAWLRREIGGAGTTDCGTMASS